MNSPKKVSQSGGPKNPDKKKTELSDTEEPIIPKIDDEDDFDLPYDDDIATFDDFDDDDDDF
jgi:hypothetical protein